MKLGNAIKDAASRWRERRACERLENQLIEGIADYFSIPVITSGDIHAAIDRTDRIRKACYADLERASDDLELLQAFRKYFTVTSGVCLTAICMDSLREMNLTITDELFEAALDKAESLKGSWMRHVGYAAVPPRENASLALTVMLSCPEREDAVLNFIEQRGLNESDNLSDLLQQLVDAPALSEGAL